MAVQNLSNDTTLSYLFKQVEAKIKNAITAFSQKVVLQSSLPLALNKGGTGATATSSTNTTVNQIATAGANFSITDASYRSWGKMAMVNITLKCTTAVTTTSSTLVCTIASGKRPALILSTVTNLGDRLYIDTSGGCYNYRTYAVDNTFAIRVCYLLA